MNSLPPRYPSNTAAPSVADLSDDIASGKLQKLKFRPSNGDFLQPPHEVFDKIVEKPKVSRNTAAENESDKDWAACEIAALKVALAKARTESRQHARVALYLRRENKRLRSEVETCRSNQIMFLEQKVEGGDIACPHDSPTSTALQHAGSFITVNDKAISTSVHDQAIQTVLTNICVLDLKEGVDDNADGDDKSTEMTTDSSLLGEALLLGDEERSSYSV